MFLLGVGSVLLPLLNVRLIRLVTFSVHRAGCEGRLIWSLCLQKALMREERADIKPALKAELRASGEAEMFCPTSLATVLARHIVRVINVIETRARRGA